MRGMKSEIKINHPVKINMRCRNPSLRIGTKRGFFNLPALTLAAIDD
jgi:hypothetical protein